MAENLSLTEVKDVDDEIVSQAGHFSSQITAQMRAAILEVGMQRDDELMQSSPPDDENYDYDDISGGW
jgi:hypothetical protein